MPYSEYLKHRALVHHAQGLSPSGIAHALAQEGLVATRQGIAKFLRRVEETGNLHQQPGSGRPSKMTPQAMRIIEAQMQRDDKTTATQLRALLLSKGYISLSTVLRSHSSLVSAYSDDRTNISGYSGHSNMERKPRWDFLT